MVRDINQYYMYFFIKSGVRTFRRNSMTSFIMFNDCCSQEYRNPILIFFPWCTNQSEKP